ALGSAAVIGEVARLARNFSFPLVVDPVMISKHGAPLMGTDAVRILVERLFPLAALVTPNLHEASELAGFPVTDRKSMEKALPIIAGMGPKTVLIKGGRLEQEGLDLLWSEGTVTAYTAPHIETPNTHGTGCVFSAVITARLARGENLAAAVHGAKQFIAEAIRTNPGLGTGRGPVNFHAPVPAVPEPRA
ncbi:MAG TPA: hydroxymethylpyrimidine/phosphomethylpyrimidine kinase, partial [bacterium]|nr:hydroxymethylpyrimidine/phosphomethylpyrimidine kinase [bacterium]